MNNTTPKGISNFEKNSTTKLQMVAKNDSNLFYAMLESSEKGLSTSTVEEKIKKFGYNEIEHEKAPSWYKQFMMAFLTPLLQFCLYW